MKVAVVCNPAKTEDEESIRVEVKRRWPDAELMSLPTTVEDPGAGQAACAVQNGVDLVLVCGGDGTVAACAGALAGSGVAMALIPTGTGNLLARNLGLPLDIEEALDVAAGDGRDHIDLLEAGPRRFAVMAGLGFDAAMMRATDANAKDRYGWLAYLAGGAHALRRSTPRRYAISVDGAPAVSLKALAVLIANVGELQGGMAVVPTADPRDGLLDVVAVAPRSWRDLPGLLARLVSGRLDTSPRTVAFRGRTVTLRTSEPAPVEFDGDEAGDVHELTIAVLARAVQLCSR